jgi:DNA invertase Pin-like site-specific DNA recombinase
VSAKAVGYIRVSTAGQATDGVSLDAQAARIRAWCEANGYDLTEILSDAGLSGKRADKRAGLQSALEAACRNRAALVVYSLSRLARSTRDAIDLAERLDTAGADLVSLTERIDTTTAAGKMVFRMLAVLAEFERDLVSERTTAALAHKRRKGERIGDIPYGWRLAQDGTNLEPIESEQTVIRDMQAMRDQGSSYRAIAEQLSRRGVPTKKGNAAWTHQAVASILRRACRRMTATL